MNASADNTEHLSSKKKKGEIIISNNNKIK